MDFRNIRRKTMLEKMLADMVDTCRTSPIAVHQGPLKGGLHIYLRKEDDGFHLVLMRQKVWPSYREWNTVIGLWPWAIEIPKPNRSTDEHEINFFMTAIIPEKVGE